MGRPRGLLRPRVPGVLFHRRRGSAAAGTGGQSQRRPDSGEKGHHPDPRLQHQQQQLTALLGWDGDLECNW